MEIYKKVLITALAAVMFFVTGCGMKSDEESSGSDTLKNSCSAVVVSEAPEASFYSNEGFPLDGNFYPLENYMLVDGMLVRLYEDERPEYVEVNCSFQGDTITVLLPQLLIFGEWNANQDGIEVIAAEKYAASGNCTGEMEGLSQDILHLELKVIDKDLKRIELPMYNIERDNSDKPIMTVVLSLEE